jgi:hypothetical protein
MLTRESILAMEPGRELDLMVEKAFFELILTTPDDPLAICDPFDVWDTTGTTHNIRFYRVKDRSTSISAAWEVFEKIKDQGAWFEVAWNPRKQRYRTLIGANNVEGMSGVDTNSETAPLAICRAALLTTISGEDSQ